MALIEGLEDVVDHVGFACEEFNRPPAWRLFKVG
jgi:hypothetical protein